MYSVLWLPTVVRIEVNGSNGYWVTPSNTKDRQRYGDSHPPGTRVSQYGYDPLCNLFVDIDDRPVNPEEDRSFISIPLLSGLSSPINRD